MRINAGVMIEERVWTEAYRPDSLDEVIGNERQVDTLKGWVDDSRVPNVLLEGPAGVGKTASARAFAKEVFGDSWKSNFIDFNASTDRGIDVVRNDIKNAARQAPAAGYEYKIIFLDESDSMSRDGMSALRRTMEQFSDQTVFFLSVNYKSKLIDPIQSRCSVLSFSRLSDSNISNILYNIIGEEGIDYEEEAVEEIVDYVRGDARRAVNTLQMSTTDQELTEESINFANTQADREDIQEMVNFAVNGDIEKAMDMNVETIIPSVTDYGRFCQDLLYAIRNDNKVKDDVRWYLISKVASLETDIMQGANPEVQINAFLAEVPVAQYSSIPQYE